MAATRSSAEAEAVAAAYWSSGGADAAVGFREGAYGREGYARRAVAVGDTLAELRYDAILTEAYAAATPVGAAALRLLHAASPPLLTPGRLALYCVMIVERAAAPPARFTAYLRAVPQRYDDPLWWDAADAAELDGSAAAVMVGDKRRWLRAALEVLLAGAGSDDAAAPLAAALSWEALLWAHSTHASRAFPAAIGVPPGAHVHPDAVGCLLPALDMLNHRYRTRIEWERRAASLAFVAGDAVAAGDQVFNNYGAKSNAEFLVGYGMVQPANRHDTYVLQVGASGAAFGAALAAAELSPRVIVGWAAAGGTTLLDSGLLPVLRLAVVTAAQPPPADAAAAAALRARVAAPLQPATLERVVLLQMALLVANALMSLAARHPHLTDSAGAGAGAVAGGAAASGAAATATAAPTATAPAAAAAPASHRVEMAREYIRGQAALLAGMLIDCGRSLRQQRGEPAAEAPPGWSPAVAVHAAPATTGVGCGAYTFTAAQRRGTVVASYSRSQLYGRSATAPAVEELWAHIDAATARSEVMDDDAPPRQRASMQLALVLIGAAHTPGPAGAAAKQLVAAFRHAFSDDAVTDFVEAVGATGAPKRPRRHAATDTGGADAADAGGADAASVADAVDADTAFWEAAHDEVVTALNNDAPAAWPPKWTSASRVAAVSRAINASAVWVPPLTGAAAPPELVLLPMWPRLPAPGAALPDSAPQVPCVAVRAHDGGVQLVTLEDAPPGGVCVVDALASALFADPPLPPGVTVTHVYDAAATAAGLAHAAAVVAYADADAVGEATMLCRERGGRCFPGHTLCSSSREGDGGRRGV